MKILKYRTIAEVYPYFSLETEIELDNGDIVYANIVVNNKGEQEEYYEDCYWTYKVPMTEVDWENVEDYYYYLTTEEDTYICETLLELWNNNPVFDNDYDWKEF